MEHPEWVVIATDITNAFGRVSRAAIAAALDSFKEHDEDMRASLTKIYFNKFVLPVITIRSRGGASFTVNEGVLMGDPISPVLFALALQPALLAAQAAMAPSTTQALSNGIILSYLDDIVFVGTCGAVNDGLNALPPQLLKSTLQSTSQSARPSFQMRASIKADTHTCGSSISSPLKPSELLPRKQLPDTR